MKVRPIVSLCLIICLLSAPAVFAKKGEKNFKLGITYEAAQQWDRAAQELTLAVAADPANMEYQLHYRRALFNASQSCMGQGRALAEQHDYAGAFNAFRQAYGYDAVNQLAVSEMRRMVRLQEESKNRDNSGPGTETEPGSLRQAYRPDTDAAIGALGIPGAAVQTRLQTGRRERLRVISYNGDLEALISNLAEQLDINVVFDTQSFQRPRTIKINLRDVTTAKALDLIFLKETLFFQKVDRRTIVVADQTRRAQYQQLVLRTFYLANIDPQDAQKLVQATIPTSVGRPMSIVTTEKSTNSLTVRDTEENVRLIGELLKNIDKERAEVVMDVQIFEVSATDLLQIGNQLGTESTLASLGGASSLATILGSRQVAKQVFSAPTTLGAALVLPQSTLALLQKKARTRVVATTQMHAFDGEKSEVHIGQRVPVQTAQVFGPSTTSSNTTTSTGYPVINYEPTGLTLEFTPQVYPNRDVQVKMSIKSNDVAGASTLTPTFTERTLSGTARIQNNQTMMIASVSQDQQSQSRAGLPLVGLLPVLGRLFTAPSNDGKQTDIVVAVTPRVLRAPEVTPRDEEMRLSGTQQAPTTESIEAVVAEADRNDQIAAARNIPTHINLQLPDQEPQSFVPAPKSMAAMIGPVPPEPDNARAILLNYTAATENSQTSVSNALTLITNARPQTLARFGEAAEKVNVNVVAPGFVLTPVTEHDKLRIGEKTRLKLMLQADEPVSFAVMKLQFDPRVIAVQKISPGALYETGIRPPQIEQSANNDGEVVLAISGATARGAGVLLVFTVEALERGEITIALTRDAVHLITANGRELSARELGQAQITIE